MDIRAYLEEILGLPPELLSETLLASAVLRELKKGELLIRQGDVQKYVIFLVSGILRGFFLDAGGREMTDCFAFRRGTPCMPGPDFTQPAPISIEALTDVTVLCIPISVVNRTMEDNMIFIKCAYRLLMESTKMHWELKNARYRYGASQRYQWFLKAYPELIEKVGNKYIASFLDMNPSTLSRQKAALRNGEERKREERKGAAPGPGSASLSDES